jgi:alanyl-tRNA synthetase
MSEYFCVPAKDIFNLVTTHGLPLDVIEILLEDDKFTYNKKEYEALWKEHQKKSRNNRNKNVF